MMQHLSNLNLLSFTLAFLAYFFIGAMWFTAFFTKAYKASLGKEGQILPNKPIFIIGPAVCTFIITLTSALLMVILNINNYSSALEFSLIIGLGFLTANTVNIAINPNIPRPILYGIITGTYHLVGMLIVSIILIAMK